MLRAPHLTLRAAEAAAWVAAVAVAILVCGGIAGPVPAWAAGIGTYAAAVRRLTRFEALGEILGRHAWSVPTAYVVLFIGLTQLDWPIDLAGAAAVPAMLAGMETATRRGSREDDPG